MGYLIFGVIAAAAGVLVYLSRQNMKLEKEIKTLQEVIAVKDTTIENFKASRVTVQEVLENINHIDEVMQHIKAGETRQETAEKLGMPLNRVETIVKLYKIKHENTSDTQ